MRFATRTAIALIVLFLIVVACIPFVQTFAFEFIEFDDNIYVYENRFVLQGLTASSLRWAMTAVLAANWHPLTCLSHMLDVELWGDWAGGHHLTNVIIHVANTLVLFGLLRSMTSGVQAWRPALVAALFAVHPLHVESVAWISERKDVLSTLFGLLALWAYVKYARKPSIGRYLAVASMFALSLMAKPMLVTLPCAMLLLDWWPLKRVCDRKSLRAIAIEKIPLLCISAASCVATILAQRAGGALMSADSVPFTGRIINATAAYAQYLYKAAWPFNLSPIYPLPAHQPLVPAILGAILLLMITSLAIALRRSHPHFLVGWLWYLGTLVPVIGIIQVGEQTLADRYTYVPLIGIFIMGIWSVPDFSKPVIINKHKSDVQSKAPASALQPIGVAFLCMMLVAIALLECRAMSQAANWKDTMTLFQHALNVTTDNYVAEERVGNEFRKRHEHEQAIAHLSRAVALRPWFVLALNSLGQTHIDAGNHTIAEQLLRKAVQYNPQDAISWNNLGVSQFYQGRVDEAERNYRRALEVNPEMPDALANLGTILLNRGQLQAAIELSRRAVEHDDDLANAHATLGAALWNTGEHGQAVVHYQRALQARPDLINTRFNLGMAFVEQANFNAAAEQFEFILRLNPEHVSAGQMLGMVREHLRDANGMP